MSAPCDTRSVRFLKRSKAGGEDEPDRAIARTDYEKDEVRDGVWKLAAPWRPCTAGWMNTCRVSRALRTWQRRCYAIRHWLGLVVFLDDGRVELDTNTVERAIRAHYARPQKCAFRGLGIRAVLLEHGDVRPDAALVHQPSKVLSRAIAGVGGKPLGPDAEPLLRPVDLVRCAVTSVAHRLFSTIPGQRRSRPRSRARVATNSCRAAQSAIGLYLRRQFPRPHIGDDLGRWSHRPDRAAFWVSGDGRGPRHPRGGEGLGNFQLPRA
jgi:transposase IS66 family protein